MANAGRTQTIALPTRSAKSFGQRRPHPGWLIEPYVPNARVTGLDGMEGIGKGLYAAHISVQVLSQGGDVIWFTAEDDPEDDLHARLLAAGWDQKNHGDVHFFDSGCFYLPENADRLIATYKQFPRLGLAVLDPVRSYLRNQETRQARYTQDEDMRPGLQVLNKVASVTRVPSLDIHHWGRAYDRAGSERYSGAPSFSQVPRHRLSFGWDKNSATGAYAVTKTNVTKKGHLRAYRVEEMPEYDTARWVDAGPLPDSDFDAWWSRASKPKEIILDPAEEIIWYCTENLEAGNKLPARDELRTLVKLNAREVEDGLRTLRDQGVVSPNGRGLLWNGLQGDH